MSRVDLTNLPFWPRYLGRDEAARYLGVNTSVFENEVKTGIWPMGRARGGRGGRLTWDRCLLDRWADQASGLLQQSELTGALGPKRPPLPLLGSKQAGSSSR